MLRGTYSPLDCPLGIDPVHVINLAKLDRDQVPFFNAAGDVGSVKLPPLPARPSTNCGRRSYQFVLSPWVLPLLPGWKSSSSVSPWRTSRPSQGRRITRWLLLLATAAILWRGKVYPPTVPRRNCPPSQRSLAHTSGIDFRGRPRNGGKIPPFITLTI
jgi:hypothetical protein